MCAGKLRLLLDQSIRFTESLRNRRIGAAQRERLSILTPPTLEHQLRMLANDATSGLSLHKVGNGLATFDDW